MGNYTFTVQIHEGQHHYNLKTAIKETEGCSNAFLCGQIIRVDLNNISEIKAEAFRNKILDRVKNDFAGTDKDVSTLFPTTAEKIKQPRSKLSKPLKNNLLKLAKAGSLSIVIFLIVYEALDLTINPTTPELHTKILNTSLLSTMIAFFSELVFLIKVNDQ